MRNALMGFQPIKNSNISMRLQFVLLADISHEWDTSKDTHLRMRNADLFQFIFHDSQLIQVLGNLELLRHYFAVHGPTD